MKRKSRFYRFATDTITHTPIVKMGGILFLLWLMFAAGLYFAELSAENSAITSYGDALYWGVAAFSTAGIADTPTSDISKVIGGAWIIIGSSLFFGTIVATITAYFMRPLQRPVRQIIETIEYNLEQLDDLSVDELEILKGTTDSLIERVERHKNFEEMRKRHLGDQ